MADDIDQEAAPDGAAGSGSQGVGSRQREPGWYTLGSNPNEQSFWNGVSWSGVRHWAVGKGWVEGEGVGAGVLPKTTAVASEPRLSANPYAETVRSQPRRTAPATFSVGVLLLVVSGIGLMFGSVGTWVHVTGSVGVVDFHLSLNGTDPGINALIGVSGWITFIGGIVLVIFGGLSMSSEEAVVVGLTFVFSLAIFVFASYDTFRMVQKISNLPASANADVSIGWGLICVLSAAALALVISVGRLLQQR